MSTGRFLVPFVRLCAFLSKQDPVEAADMIFVLAGRIERKQYGLELFRAKVAPRLLLSVGRFEVSRMNQLELGRFELTTLISLRDKAPAEDRNFFVCLDSIGSSIERANLPRSSTWGEAVALRRWLTGTALRKVLVVSTDVHLRRVALTFREVFLDDPVSFIYCPVPRRLSCSLKRTGQRLIDYSC
jgi:hypothetical protein